MSKNGKVVLIKLNPNEDLPYSSVKDLLTYLKKNGLFEIVLNQTCMKKNLIRKDSPGDLDLPWIQVRIEYDYEITFNGIFCFKSEGSPVVFDDYDNNVRDQIRDFLEERPLSPTEFESYLIRNKQFFIMVSNYVSSNQFNNLQFNIARAKKIREKIVQCENMRSELTKEIELLTQELIALEEPSHSTTNDELSFDDKTR